MDLGSKGKKFSLHKYTKKMDHAGGLRRKVPLYEVGALSFRLWGTKQKSKVRWCGKCAHKSTEENLHNAPFLFDDSKLHIY